MEQFLSCLSSKITIQILQYAIILTIIVLLFFYCKNMKPKSKPIQVTSLFYEAGRPFKYDQFFTSGHKRHFWDDPTKNYGFFTSDQMEERRRRFKTVGDSQKNQRFEYKEDSNFLVSSLNPEHIHCCTCHNNPHRYAYNSQKCRFCEQNLKKSQQYSSKKKGSRMNTREVNSRGAQWEDKIIQVNLPKLNHRHKDKSIDKCEACKDKKKNRQELGFSSNKKLVQSAKKPLEAHFRSPSHKFKPFI